MFIGSCHLLGHPSNPSNLFLSVCLIIYQDLYPTPLQIKPAYKALIPPLLLSSQQPCEDDEAEIR